MGHFCSHLPPVESCEDIPLPDKRVNRLRLESAANRCRELIVRHPQQTEPIFCLVDLLILGADLRVEDLISTPLETRSLKNITRNEVIRVLQIKILILKLADLLSEAPTDFSRVVILPKHVERTRFKKCVLSTIEPIEVFLDLSRQLLQFLPNSTHPLYFIVQCIFTSKIPIQASDLKETDFEGPTPEKVDRDALVATLCRRVLAKDSQYADTMATLAGCFVHGATITHGDLKGSQFASQSVDSVKALPLALYFLKRGLFIDRDNQDFQKALKDLDTLSKVKNSIEHFFQLSQQKLAWLHSQESLLPPLPVIKKRTVFLTS